MARRALLTTAANPDPRADFLVMLSVVARPALGEISLTVRYVPDKLVLEPASLAAYGSAVDGVAWRDLESLAVAIRDDIANELVPRWLQTVAARRGETGADVGTTDHQVLLEDRQPGWDNPALLRSVPASL